MSFPRHPLRPLAHALRALSTQIGDAGLWGPFVLVALCKAGFLLGLARLDRLPAAFLAVPLAGLPGLDRHLHYPDLVLFLPRAARILDLTLFLTVGALLQGWVILRLARAWTGEAPPLFPGWRRGAARVLALVTIAAIQVGVPFAVLRLLHAGGAASQAPRLSLVAGAVLQTLLLAAPAFVVLHGLSLRRSVSSSVRLIARLPLALPLAVVLLVALHVPGLMLRGPAIAAGAGYDPDWILAALLGQIPADVLGAVLAAGLAAYFASRTRVRETRRGTPARAAAVALVLLSLPWSAGCDVDAARQVQRRYAAERCVERARLRALELRGDAGADSLAWLQVAKLNDEAVRRLGEVELRSPAGRVRQMAKLSCRARLARAEALLEAGRTAPARSDYADLLERADAFRSVRADAALGLARSEDRAGRWDRASMRFEAWMRGVRDGEWPLRRQGLETPLYVARRLRDRGARGERDAWIQLCADGLEAAAVRGELARQARYGRFVVLLTAERWAEAHQALRRCRELHDPEGRDGALLVAEASLLAGGLRRQREALGILSGLHAEKSGFDSQHRVAGWLLAAQIHLRDGDLAAALHAYEAAAGESRSESGRSEAALGLARVYAARGDIDLARRTYAQLRQVYRATPAGLIGSLDELRLLRERGDAAAARALVPEVVHQYRTVIQQFGTELPALLAAQSMSECLGEAGQWERGVAYLDSIVDVFGGDPRAGSLLVRAARLAVERLDDRERARQLLARLHARYPDSDVAVLARALEDSLDIGRP